MFVKRVFDDPGYGFRNPLFEMDRLRRQMEALSGLASQGWPSRVYASSGVFPLINLTEDENSYYVRAELPGIHAEDLDIQVAGRSLAISGERSIASEGEKVRYHRREREAGKFSRVIGLPGQIDAENVRARTENGVLTVTIAKSEASKPRKITVA